MGELLEPEGGADAAATAAVEADSIALGIALDRVRSRRGKRTAGDDSADRLLTAQEALISDQREHLREQLKQMRLKHFGERLKVTIQLMTIALGAAVVASVAWMAIDAIRAEGVVIKPFAVAPDLARRGVTGEVVASQLLDKLDDINDRSQSSAALGKFGAGFGQNLSLQIPETGVSLGEVDRWLRERLGHERNLTGEIIENPDGTLTVSARLDAKPLPPQTGPAADLPRLILRTAELLYRREQPMTYVQYLTHTPGRLDEQEEVAREMTDSHDPVVRAFGHGSLAIAGAARGDNATRVREYREADAENSGIAWAADNLAVAAQNEGHYEEALRLMNRALALTPHDPSDTPEARAAGLLRGGISKATLLHDHATAFSKMLTLSQGDNPGNAGSRAALQVMVAYFRGLAHDGLRAESDAIAFAPRSPADEVIKAQSLAAIDWARQDWKSFLDRLDAAELRNAVVQLGGDEAKAFRARALTGLGRVADAEAVIAPTALDCVPCVVDRGQVAEAAGRRAEADHWFAEASRIAPSIPDGPLYWGQALLARGDAARAAAQFREVLRRSPRADDAMEGLGEALAAQGDTAGAVKRFVAANALTPKWGRLHLKWGEALMKLGKRDEAKAQFKAAATMDLTPTERAELAAQKV